MSKKAPAFLGKACARALRNELARGGEVHGFPRAGITPASHSAGHPALGLADGLLFRLRSWQPQSSKHLLRTQNHQDSYVEWAVELCDDAIAC